MATKKADKYAQKLFLDVTMSAANTLTFSGATISSGVGMSEALLLHRINYYPEGINDEMAQESDIVKMGLCGSQDLDSMSVNQPQVYDSKTVHLIYLDNTGFEIQYSPLVTDFSNLPGGGLLVPADRLYLGMDTEGFAAADAMSAVIYFTLVTLAPQDYIELAQSLRVLT